MMLILPESIHVIILDS